MTAALGVRKDLTDSAAYLHLSSARCETAKGITGRVFHPIIFSDVDRVRLFGKFVKVILAPAYLISKKEYL